MDKEIIIIDLDGTFVSVNTFHKWMKFLFTEELKQIHLLTCTQILYIIFLRFFKSITHKEMKFRILQLSEKQITQKRINTFVDTLDPYVNQTILHTLQNTSHPTLLATAAPLLYAESIKEKYHFNAIIATPYTHVKPWIENIKEEKKNAYLQFLLKHTLNPKKVIFYTDHYDDLPLMEISHFTYLVQPSDATKNAALEAGVSFEVIK